MSETFRWLHLTDLHWGHWLQDEDWAEFEELFFKDLGKRLGCKDGYLPVHAVFFTGDLVNKGQPDEYQGLNGFLEDLWEWFSKRGSIPFFLPVPGNHDLIRPKPKAKGLGFLELWRESERDSPAFWDKTDHDDLHNLIGEAFRPYEEWWEKLPAGIRKPEKLQRGLFPGEYAAQLEIGDLKVGVLGINSAICHLVDGIEEGHLQMSTRQLLACCTNKYPKWFKSNRLNFLLSHHPHYWLSEVGKRAYQHIYRPARFAAHLFGHVHEHHMEFSFEKGARHARKPITGLSLFGRESWTGKPNNEDRRYGYTIGTVAIEVNKGFLRLWPRQLKVLDDDSWVMEKADKWHYDDDKEDMGTWECEVPLLPQTPLPFSWPGTESPAENELGTSARGWEAPPVAGGDDASQPYEEVIHRGLMSHLENVCFVEFLPVLQRNLGHRDAVDARKLLEMGFSRVVSALPLSLDQWMRRPDFRRIRENSVYFLDALEVLVGWLSTTPIRPEWQPEKGHEAHPDLGEWVLFLPVRHALSVEMLLTKIRQKGRASFKLEWHGAFHQIKAPGVVHLPDFLEPGPVDKDLVDEIKAQLLYMVAPQDEPLLWEKDASGKRIRAKPFDRKLDKRLAERLAYSEGQPLKTAPCLLLNPGLTRLEKIPADAVARLSRDLQPQEKDKHLKIVGLFEGSGVWREGINEEKAMAELDGFYEKVAEARRILEG